jgi:hypothetical protein
VCGFGGLSISSTSQLKLHPVFHISCLKKVIGTKFQTQTNLPELDEEGSIWLQPQVVLAQRERCLHQRTIQEVLVQWKDTPPEDATSTTIPLFEALRTRLFFKGEGLLGK